MIRFYMDCAKLFMATLLQSLVGLLLLINTDCLFKFCSLIQSDQVLTGIFWMITKYILILFVTGMCNWNLQKVTNRKSRLWMCNVIAVRATKCMNSEHAQTHVICMLAYMRCTLTSVLCSPVKSELLCHVSWIFPLSVTAAVSA